MLHINSFKMCIFLFQESCKRVRKSLRRLNSTNSCRRNRSNLLQVIPDSSIVVDSNNSNENNQPDQPDTPNESQTTDTNRVVNLDSSGLSSTRPNTSRIHRYSNRRRSQVFLFYTSCLV